MANFLRRFSAVPRFRRSSKRVSSSSSNASCRSNNMDASSFERDPWASSAINENEGGNTTRLSAFDLASRSSTTRLSSPVATIPSASEKRAQRRRWSPVSTDATVSSNNAAARPVR
ncbi:hypothetical protein H257_15275 [Aphanomyces astaci]|uniref:Uncharacterized protein n=1 Tax=Aphanomyces astaci TaxID=112090 RepID=W4FQ21_APHAT|nr:hypothetical protein H257_15275 [Aphanomyces astaci]ETV68934.1 hypothetical protein H257_15275 [Aphanomyces astaci]|eukprot:XP_009841611.1 hypothetical protein H257_15275 [Aphanomyces astaci]